MVHKDFVSVIVPAYNEKDCIAKVLKNTATVLRSVGLAFELIAVDDCSTDGTVEEIRPLCDQFPELKLVELRKNSGQTAALSAGFHFATGGIIVTMDADGQNDPTDIASLVGLITKEGYDCALGWRQNRNDNFILRRFPSAIANMAIRYLWKTDVKDFGCALKAFRKDIVDELSFYGEMHRLLGLLLLGVGAKVASVPVKHHPRVTGKSKYGLERTAKVILDLSTIWFLDRFKAKPIHVFGMASMGFFATGLTCFAVCIGQKLWLETSINRNPLFFLFIFLNIAAIQIWGVGLLSELLVRVYFESTSRKPFYIRRTTNLTTEPVRKVAG